MSLVSLNTFVKSTMKLNSYLLSTGFDGRAHPDNAQHEKYGLCVDGITQLKANCASILPACYVWLDFGCINQNGNPAGELKQLDMIVKSSDCIFTPIGESICVFVVKVKL